MEAAAALLLGKEILEVSGEVVGSLVMAVFTDDDDDFDEAADLMAHGLSRADANVAQAAAGCGLGKAIGKLLPKKKGGAPAAEPEPGAPAPEGGTAGSKSAKPLSEQGPGTPAKPNAPA